MPLSFIVLSLFLSGIVYFVAYIITGFVVDFSFITFSGVFSYFVYSATWLAAIIVFTKMAVHEGNRADRLMLSASCLILIATLLSFPVAYPLIKAWLQQGGYAASHIVGVLGNVGIYNMLGGWLGVAGIICLIRAFWTKSKVSNGG